MSLQPKDQDAGIYSGTGTFPQRAESGCGQGRKLKLAWQSLRYLSQIKSDTIRGLLCGHFPPAVKVRCDASYLLDAIWISYCLVSE